MKGSTWMITDANGMTHELSCRIRSFGGPEITIDGNAYRVKSSNWLVNIVDYSVDFPGVNCHVVMIGNKSRLAVNGTYNDDGTAYESVTSLPSWIWVLVGFSVIGGLLFGGWPFAAIGIVFSTIYISSALEKKTSKAVIMFVVFAVLLVIWAGVQVALRLNGVI